jgi:hypothetical protein
MSLRAAHKTVWLLIAAAFLIGLGMIGVGFAFGGLSPTGFGPGGMRYVDVRTGNVYDSRLNLRTEASETLDGIVLGTELNSIRVTSPIANVRIEQAPGADLSYRVDSRNSIQYRATSDNGHLVISPVIEPTVFGFGSWNVGSWGNSGNDEITIWLPEDVTLNAIEVNTVSGSIESSVPLLADRVTLTIVSGNINVNAVGGAQNPAQSLELNSVSGSIVVGPSVLNRLDLSQVSGSTTISLYDLDNYSINVGRVSSSVTAGGNNLPNGMTTFGSGTRSAGISTVSGNVTLATATDTYAP